MANEISYQFSLAASKEGAGINTGYLTGTRDMSAGDVLQATQTIQSGVEAVNVGDVATVGELVLVNIEDAGTGDVSLSYNSNGTSPFATVAAGAPPTCVRPTGLPVYAKADLPLRLLVAVTSV